MEFKAAATDATITREQAAFFRTFGYLKLPGVFSGEIGEISAAFDQLFEEFESSRVDMSGVAIHGYGERTMIPAFVDRHPDLARLRTDPRISGIVTPLLGDAAEYRDSDGNIFSCDTEWHCDIFGAPMKIQHLKISLYLDPVRAESGAPRVIPGTNHSQSEYARSLRSSFGENISHVEDVYGVVARDVPSVVLDSDPGDVLLWDYRTIHASYGGGPRRRLITMNFRVPAGAE